MVVVGCSTTNTRTIIEEDIIEKIHPEMPRPISAYYPKLYIEEFDDGELYVYMTFRDSQNMRIMLNDTHRYIKESNDLLCFYRKKLNEEFCVKDLNVKK